MRILFALIILALLTGSLSYTKSDFCKYDIDYPDDQFDQPDAIIVLTGGINENGTLSKIGMERADKAIELSGNVPIVVSGYWTFLVNYTPAISEAQAMKIYAEAAGAQGEVFAEENSLDTLGGAYFTKINFAEKNNWSKIIVVTSDFHMQRTRYLFKKVYGQKYKMKFIEAPHNLSEKEFVKTRERKFLALEKNWLFSIKDGDTQGIKNFLYTKHPGYSKKIQPEPEALALVLC